MIDVKPFSFVIKTKGEIMCEELSNTLSKEIDKLIIEELLKKK